MAAPPCGNREVRREVVKQWRFFADTIGAYERIDADALL
jgi:hypothetical protein